jgi:ADP-ribose pyrophosphatase
LEIPAGTLNPGEEPWACAQRELQEETGYRAGRMERIGGFYVSPGYCTEFIHLFLATNLEPSSLQADADEAIELVRSPLSVVPQLIASGEICDAKTIAGLLSALTLYGEVSNWPNHDNDKPEAKV